MKKLRQVGLAISILGLATLSNANPQAVASNRDRIDNSWTEKFNASDGAVIRITMHEKALNVPRAVSHPDYKSENGSPRLFMQHKNINDPEHLWKIMACKDGRGGFGLKNIGNGRMLNVQTVDSYNGGRVGSWLGDDPCHPDQNLKVKSHGHMRFAFISTRAGRALDAPWQGRELIARIKGNGNLVLYPYKGNRNQVFNIERVSGTLRFPTLPPR